VEILAFLTINGRLENSFNLKSLALKGWDSMSEILDLFWSCTYCSFEGVFDLNWLLIDLKSDRMRGLKLVAGLLF